MAALTMERDKNMIQTLYRPKRWRNGKRITSRLYSARIRIDGERQILNVPLHVSDKQVAQEKLRKLVQEKEKELHGLTPAKAMRDAAQEFLTKHIKDFVADLRAKGRNRQYVNEFENRLLLLMGQCRWKLPKDVSADSFIKWRIENKTKSAKTLNEYLTCAKGLLHWMILQGRIVVNPLAVVQNAETRGKEVRKHRAYLNDHRIKRIIIDPERAPIVKEAFERYATGEETYETLSGIFAKRGILTGNGKHLPKVNISYLLCNPVYYGHFRYAGEVHEGKHELIISKALFDQVQAVMTRRFRWNPKTLKRTPKAYVSLLHCGGCGYSVTAEVQKGHTYYRCTRKNRAHQCKQPYVREEALDAEISALLKPFALRSDWADEMLSRIKGEKKSAAQSALQLAAQKREEIERVSLRLQRLLDSFLDGVIDRNDYTAEKAKLMSQKKTLEEQKDAFVAGRADWLEPFQNWIITARNAGEIAVRGSPQEKKVLAQKVFGSNLVLDCKKARGSCVKPWSLLVENSSTGGMVRDTGFEPVTPTVSM
jgi:hypothetical protein